MNTSPDHPDFTALALGEHIHGTPVHAVLDALRTSVAARNEAQQIRGTAQRLAVALKGQPPLRLGAERRHAILNADPAVVRARFAAEDAAAFVPEPALPVARSPRRWVYPGIAAAAVAAAAVLVLRLLPGLTMPAQKDTGPVAESEPTGKVMVTSPERDASGRNKALILPAAPSIVDKDSIVLPPGKGRDLPESSLPSSLVKEASADVPGLPADVIVPPPSGVPPPRPDPRNFDYATPIVPKAPRSRK